MAAGKNGLLDIKPVIDISIGDVVEIRSSNSVVMRATQIGRASCRERV